MHLPIASLLALGALSLPASAQVTTYQLASQAAYSSFIPCMPAGSTACEAYTSAMTVAGQFTLSAPLAASLSATTLAPTAFSFSDGVNTYTEAGAWVHRLMVWTDASGALTQFNLEVRKWLTGTPPHAVGDRLSTLYIDQSLFSATHNAECSFIPVGQSADNCTLLTDWQFTHNASGALSGTFAAASAPMGPQPIPSLSVHGLAGLSALLAAAAGLRRRHRRGRQCGHDAARP